MRYLEVAWTYAVRRLILQQNVNNLYRVFNVIIETNFIDFSRKSEIQWDYVASLKIEGKCYCWNSSYWKLCTTSPDWLRIKFQLCKFENISLFNRLKIIIISIQKPLCSIDF